jgi:hypothetical protein
MKHLIKVLELIEELSPREHPKKLERYRELIQEFLLNVYLYNISSSIQKLWHKRLKTHLDLTYFLVYKNSLCK